MDFLVTADISSLFTNMDTSLIYYYVSQQLARYPDPNRPDGTLMDILELLLNSNDFDFDGKTYLQTMGCLMGLCCSPSLANIFLIDFDYRATHDFRM